MDKYNSNSSNNTYVVLIHKYLIGIFHENSEKLVLHSLDNIEMTLENLRICFRLN